MLLGIVLHAALVYIPPQGAWLVQDVERHAGFGWFVSAVHGFRMPLFFLVSGFFTAMLWRKRGVRALLWHRFRRIVLPLALGMVTIIPAMWGAGYYIAGHLPEVDAKESIWAAARAGDVDAIRGHLANGAELEQRDEQLTVTALSTASIMGQLEAVRALLDQGADANTLNGDGGTALHGAAFFGHDQIAKLLLEHGADVNIENRHGETPLDTTRHDWGVVEYIARIVQYNPDQEQVAQGREIVVQLIETHPEWQPPAPENSLAKKADGEIERPPASFLPFIR